MESNYNFSEQEKMFGVAVSILQDYNASEWSFGGGTALSILHYQHRMSYDIDIFSEDYSLIQNLIDNRNEIGRLLGVPPSRIKESPGGLTFIVSDTNAKLKLDFVYQSPLTSSPYAIADVFGHKQIKVQSVKEILSKKIKYREPITIRDYIDFYFADKHGEGLGASMLEDITSIDRYIDIVKQFNDLNAEYFNQELEFINPFGIVEKSDIAEIINSSIYFPQTIKVAYDETGEIVAFENFVDRYRDGYTGVFGEYNIVTIDRAEAMRKLNIEGRPLNFSDLYETNIKPIESAIIEYTLDSPANLNGSKW
jgi:hypothetical protein